MEAAGSQWQDSRQAGWGRVWTPRPVTVSAGPADSAENLFRKWELPGGAGITRQSLEHQRPRRSGRRARLQAGGLRSAPPSPADTRCALL